MRTILFLSAAILLADTSFACSCGLHRNTVEEEYRASDAVFRGTVVSSQLSPMKGPPSVCFYEHVIFRVEDAWKGVRKGQLVKFVTGVCPGQCGLSSRSAATSVFFNEGLLDPGTKRLTDWLLYVRGTEPYQLLLCSRSSPMRGYAQGSASEDVPALDRLAGKR
jgi:hypothetical protein